MTADMFFFMSSALSTFYRDNQYSLKDRRKEEGREKEKKNIDMAYLKKGEGVDQL